MPTPFRNVPPESFPTRYEAFEHQGEWCILDVTDASPAAHWLEIAVYSNQAMKTHAEIRRHPTTIKGKRFVADVYRAGHGASLLASDFNGAFDLAADWLGLS